jgi:hypothetical protein
VAYLTFYFKVSNFRVSKNYLSIYYSVDDYETNIDDCDDPRSAELLPHPQGHSSLSISYEHRLNMEVVIQSLFGLHTT